ncbi:RNA polymerase I enhancer binding protein [Mortierella sp. 14UC]|nr:RNA polymerase I enhancer binding protein [Mortierella sp. 14UC]
MENQFEVNRKRKNTEEESTAGFKKALVSATTTCDHGLNEFGAQELPSGSAPQADTRPHGHVTRLLPTNIRRDQPSRTPTTSEVQAADAVLSTMVGILAGTGDGRHELSHTQQPEHHPTQQTRLNQHHHSTSHHNATGAVSDDVLHMQQQLQQQIPLDSSAQSRLTHHQLMDSMSSIPNMQLLLEENLKRDLLQKREGADGQRRQEDTMASAQSSAVEDARTVLMKLNDPSILVTLKPHTVHTPQPSHPSSPLPSSSSVNLPPVSNPGKGKKKAKTPRAGSGAATGASKDGVDTPGFDFQEKLRSDTAAVSSDNPLHTKWLMATALKDKGISYKTGTFSSHEDELIRETIKGYVARNSMPEDAIQRWFENGNGRGRFEKNDLKALWVEIAVRLQNRPLLNIYLHVRRMFHPQNNIGTWSKEDDQKLIMLHALHKGQWTTIGTELGRMADSCRDRYRNHLKDQNTMLTGPWQPHEDEQLLTIMQDLALQQGKINILDSSPMWTLISERMHGTRTRHQCRHRYSQTLQPRLERGEWTAPSSAAAAAAAAVAANAAVAASASSSSSSKQASQHLQAHTGTLGLGLSPNQGLSPNHGVNSGHEQGKTTAEQDVLMIAAALQGVLPNHDNGHMLWSQAVSNDMHGQDSHHSISPGSHDPFTAAAIAAAAASLPLPTIVPKAPKGPIRRRSGLQQQLDTLRIIQEDGYTDHTDIDWSNIAQRLRDRVEEANAIQLAKIIQTHDQLDSKKQRHLQDGDSAAAAAAAASAAMAAAVSAAQAEAVASLQRVPAANQCARTFMSSRCKIEGYRDMTLQQVIVFMMKDVERRIMHRRGGPGSSSKRNDSSGGGADGAEGSSSKSTPSGALSKEASKEAVIQQQEIIINNAAQQAAIAALSAQFPFLQQHHQQQHGQSALAHALSDPLEPHFSAHSSSSASAIPQTSSAPPSSSSYAAYSEESLSVEQRAQRQQELEQQQHNHDLAEQMLNFAFSITDMSPNLFQQHPHLGHCNHQHAPHQHQQQHQQGSILISPSMSSTSSMSSVSSSSWPVDEASSSATASQREKQATRRVLHALKSSDFATDTSEDDDEVEDGSQANPQG